MIKLSNLIGVMAVATALCVAQPAYAQSRNASFVNPGAVQTKSGDLKGSQANTLVAEPSSIDAGETLVNIARRVTVFFYNGFRTPIQINDLTLNADGNVRSRVVTDDCKAVKTLPMQDKCAIALEITPSSPGPWTVELLLNHSGAGRIARAEVNGSTLGKADEKSEGLAISKKIAAPLDFGSVAANQEKAARTMLIENDSPMPLVISSIDLIASQQDGLSVRHNGCKEGDELKPGESCPITVIWEPSGKGNIATDLIVRHSGNLGFVVVPIRGAGTVTASKEDPGESGSNKSLIPSSTSSVLSSAAGASLMPRGSSDMQARAAMPGLDTLPLPGNTLASSDLSVSKSARRRSPPNVKNMVGDDAELELPKVLLIGTVGKRAILGDTQEQTYMVNLGEKVSIGGVDVELVQLDPTHAVVMMGSKRINLSLRNMQTIAYQTEERSDDSDSGKSKSGKSALPRSGAPALTDKPTMPPTDAPMMNGPGAMQNPGSGPAIADPSAAVNQQSSTMTAQDVLNMMK